MSEEASQETREELCQADREIRAILEDFKREQVAGQQLFASYQEMVTADVLFEASPTKRKQFRNYLRSHGVRVRQGQGVPILDALFELLLNTRPNRSDPCGSDPLETSSSSGTKENLRIYSYHPRKYGKGLEENISRFEERFKLD